MFKSLFKHLVWKLAIFSIVFQRLVSFHTDKFKTHTQLRRYLVSAETSMLVRDNTGPWAINNAGFVRVTAVRRQIQLSQIWHLYLTYYHWSIPYQDQTNRIIKSKASSKFEGANDMGTDTMVINQVACGN